MNVKIRSAFTGKTSQKAHPEKELSFDLIMLPIEMKCFDCSGTFSMDEERRKHPCVSFVSADHLHVNEEDVRLESIELE